MTFDNAKLNVESTTSLCATSRVTIRNRTLCNDDDVVSVVGSVV